MASAAVVQTSWSLRAAKLGCTFLESTSPENSSGLSCDRAKDLQERFLRSLAQRARLSLSNVHAVMQNRSQNPVCNVTVFNQRCSNFEGFFPVEVLISHWLNLAKRETSAPEIYYTCSDMLIHFRQKLELRSYL